MSDGAKKKKSAPKRYGLQLRGVNGEPDTPHTIPPLPGFFRVGEPTPVGGEGEIPLDQARAALEEPFNRDEDGNPIVDEETGEFVDEKGEPIEPEGRYALGQILELVTIPKTKVDEAVRRAADDVISAHGGIAAARQGVRDRELTPDEVIRINQEAAAVQGAVGVVEAASDTEPAESTDGEGGNE